MKAVFRKLKTRRGETLIESLVAILAFAISTVVMYSMVTAAMNMNYNAREADKAFQNEVKTAEQAQGSGRSGTVTLTLTQSPANSQDKKMGEVVVKVYGDTDGLYAYYKVPKGGT